MKTPEEYIEETESIDLFKSLGSVRAWALIDLMQGYADHVVKESDSENK